MHKLDISSHHFQTVLLVKSTLQRPDQLRSGSRCQPSPATAGDLPGKSTLFNSRAGNYTANLVPHRSNTPSHLPTEPESRTLQLVRTVTIPAALQVLTSSLRRAPLPPAKTAWDIKSRHLPDSQRFLWLPLKLSLAQ